MSFERCDPYAMDFGDSEYMAWLERWLTWAELAERERCWERYLRWEPWPWGWDSLGPYRRGELRGMWQWPLAAVWLRRLRRFLQLARERSGQEPPAPSWKVRTEWGVPGG